MTDEPAADDLERGHVVLAPDPFVIADETTRPWVVVNNERMPFDKQQYIVMGMTTRTWYEERVPLSADDYQHRRAPEESSIVPHAVASLGPALPRARSPDVVQPHPAAGVTAASAAVRCR